MDGAPGTMLARSDSSALSLGAGLGGEDGGGDDGAGTTGTGGNGGASSAAGSAIKLNPPLVSGAGDMKENPFPSAGSTASGGALSSSTELPPPIKLKALTGAACSSSGTGEGASPPIKLNALLGSSGAVEAASSFLATMR